LVPCSGLFRETEAGNPEMDECLSYAPASDEMICLQMRCLPAMLLLAGERESGSSDREAFTG